MKKCAVLSGGEIADYSQIDVSQLKDCVIISADSGYYHAKALGLKTDYLIGDFDSIDFVPKDASEVIEFPSEKDDTDTMLAIKLALNLGFEDITIVGGLGKRLYHTL
ncbi:MAG: thiamine pyrophosphokinase, partial [Oscillospiraceae bacterium]